MCSGWFVYTVVMEVEAIDSFSKREVIVRLVKVGVCTLGLTVLRLGSDARQRSRPPSGTGLNLAITTFSGKQFLTLD